jgi:predicted DNA binding protein
MCKSAIEVCSALVHKFEANVCAILNSTETDSPTHSYVEDNDEVEEERQEEEEQNEMIASSDISTSNKEQIKTTMGNKIVKSKDKMTNYTELTDRQVEFLVTSTNFSPQQVREWHQSLFDFSPKVLS